MHDLPSMMRPSWRASLLAARLSKDSTIKKNLIQKNLIEFKSTSNLWFEIHNSYEKSFDFDWDRTPVPALAIPQRWPLGHPANFIQKILLIFI